MYSIKVLHFYKTSILDTMGGVEVFMDTLCNATANLGIDNTILALSKNPSKDINLMPRYKILQTKQNFFIASTGFSFSAFKKFRELVAEADIIHYHFPNPFADVLHFSCLINKPTIVTYHSDIIKQKHLLKIYNPLMHKFLLSADKIIATSPNYFSTSDILQHYASKVRIIPIGLNRESFPLLKTERLSYWRKLLPADFFLFIGSMRYYKGLYTALDAIKGTTLHLVLAGNGGIENDLKDYAQKNAINNAHFIGPISEEDKIALHTLSKAFVFPSNARSEAFGISLLEAASLRKPLISCEIGTGTSFVNVNNETGLVIEHSSPLELRSAMKFLVENNDAAIKFGANAEQRYLKFFTATKQAESYVDVYRELLPDGSSRADTFALPKA